MSTSSANNRPDFLNTQHDKVAINVQQCRNIDYELDNGITKDEFMKSLGLNALNIRDSVSSNQTDIKGKENVTNTRPKASYTEISEVLETVVEACNDKQRSPYSSVSANKKKCRLSLKHKQSTTETDIMEAKQKKHDDTSNHDNKSLQTKNNLQEVQPIKEGKEQTNLICT